MIPPDTRFEDILPAARRGDDRALTQLYRALFPLVLRYAEAAAPGDAEDVAADTWIDVVRGLDRFEGDERAFRAWSFTIARRRVLDLRRRRARRRTDPWDPADLAETGDNGHAEHDAMASLGTSWAVSLIASSLPPDQAEVLLLRVLGDLGAAEVAAIVGKRVGTVRVLQHRALRRLAQILQESPVTR